MPPPTETIASAGVKVLENTVNWAYLHPNDFGVYAIGVFFLGLFLCVAAPKIIQILTYQTRTDLKGWRIETISRFPLLR